MTGSMKEKRPGVWRLIVTRGYETDPATGKVKQLQSWSTFKGTKRKAQAKLNELIGSVQSGTFVEPTRMTVIDWLREWLKVSVTPTARPGTVTRYRGIIENHI